MSSKGSLRLRFKGEEATAKKKKKKRSRVDGEDADNKQAGPPNGNEQAWVPVERITDLAGPTFLFQRLTVGDDEQGRAGPSRYYCLALNPALHRVEAHPLRPVSLLDDEKAKASLDLEGAEVVIDEEESYSGYTPTDVTQVWVTTRILDTPSSAPRYSLRSSEARFLTSEPKTGSVSAFAEARGPLAEWTLVEGIGGKPGRRRYCLESANATLLGLDEVAGGKVVVRNEFDVKQGESPPGPSEHWEIRVQWKFREQARKKEEGEKPLRERDSTFKRVKS